MQDTVVQECVCVRVIMKEVRIDGKHRSDAVINKQ